MSARANLNKIYQISFYLHFHISVLAKMDDVREVKLKRSDSIGLGFSVFGGKGSGFPPVIYQVVDESPAAVSGVVSDYLNFFFRDACVSADA